MEETINDQFKEITERETYQNSRKPSAVAREMGSPEEAPVSAANLPAEATPAPVAMEALPAEQQPQDKAVLTPEAQAAVISENLRVIDGDTFVKDGKTYRLRRVDAPELRQPHGEASRDALGEVLRSGNVEIIPVETDKYGRTIADVKVDGEYIATRLVKSGNAWHYEGEQSDMSESLYSAQEEARKEGRGLFGIKDQPIDEPRAHRRGTWSKEQAHRWEQIRRWHLEQTKDVVTPEMLRRKALAEKKAKESKAEPTEKERELGAVIGVASSVAVLAKIGFRAEMLGRDLMTYELDEALREFKDSFGYTMDDFRAEGWDDPYDAVRKYIKSAMEIVRTMEKRQENFNALSPEEQQEMMNAAVYGEDAGLKKWFSYDEVKQFSESMTINCILEHAFANGATAETVVTATMMALSEHQSAEEHKNRLLRMPLEQARKAADIAGAIRAQYDGNFVAKGLIATWNAAEALVDNIGATVTGDAVGVATNERVVDLLAQQMEDTAIDTSDWMGEVAVTIGESVPAMGLLASGAIAAPFTGGGSLAVAIGVAGTAAYMASAYGEASSIPVLEDWHDVDQRKVEAFKLTYAFGSPLIEKGVLGLAMKPVSKVAKASGVISPKLSGLLSTKTLAMRLAGVQQKSALSKISKGVWVTAGRSVLAGVAEIPEEVASQALLTGGAMFVDPASANGRKLYGIERFNRETIEAAWMAFKTGPFIALPFAGVGVGQEAFGLKLKAGMEYYAIDPEKRPNILEFQQQVINAQAALDAKMQAQTVGGLTTEEAAAFYESDAGARKKILDETTDKNKKKWLSRMDKYLAIVEEQKKNQKKESDKPGASLTIPGQGPFSDDELPPENPEEDEADGKRMLDIALNSEGSDERVPEIDGSDEEQAKPEAEPQPEAKPESAENESEEGHPEVVPAEEPKSAKMPPESAANAVSEQEVVPAEETPSEPVSAQENAPFVPTRAANVGVPVIDNDIENELSDQADAELDARERAEQEEGALVEIERLSGEIKVAEGKIAELEEKIKTANAKSKGGFTAQRNRLQKKVEALKAEYEGVVKKQLEAEGKAKQSQAEAQEKPVGEAQQQQASGGQPVLTTDDGAKPKKRYRIPVKSTKATKIVKKAEDIAKGKRSARKRSVDAEDAAKTAQKRFALNDGSFRFLSPEINAAYGEKSDGEATLNPSLVELFKGAIEEEAKTGVGIMDIFAVLYGRMLVDSINDPDLHKNFQDDPVLWAENTISDMIELARRHKDGDIGATSNLEKYFAWDKSSRIVHAGQMERGKVGLVSEHKYLRPFADFAKKWLRSVFGHDANIYFVEDLVYSTDPEHVKVVNDFEKMGGRAKGCLFLKSGNVYISKSANPVKVLHEVFGHATWQWMKKNDRKGYEKLVRLAINAPKEIKERVARNYGVPDMTLKGEELERQVDKFLDEVFAHLMEARYAGRIDSLFTTHEGRTWYEKIWDLISKAISGLWKAFSGSDAGVDPEEFLDSLSERFFGYKGIFVGADGKSDGVRFAIDDIQSEVEGIFGEYENQGGQYDDNPFNGLTVNNDGEVDFFEQDPDVGLDNLDPADSVYEENDREEGNNEDTESNNDEEVEVDPVDLVDAMTRFDNSDDDGVAQPAKEYGGEIDRETAAKPTFLGADKDYFNPYDLRTVFAEWLNAVDNLTTRLGLDWYSMGLNANFQLFPDVDENGNPVGQEYESLWEREKASILKTKKGKERRITEILFDILEYFSAHPLKGKISFETQEAEALDAKLEEAYDILDTMKQGSSTVERLDRQLAAAELIVGLAIKNSNDFIAIKGIVGGYINMLRPQNRNIGQLEADPTSADMSEYGLENLYDLKSGNAPISELKLPRVAVVDVTNRKTSKKYTTPGRTLEVQALEEARDSVINTGGLIKNYEAIQEVVKPFVERYKDHENRAVQRFIRQLVDTMKLAEENADKEYQAYKNEAFMQALIHNEGKSPEEAERIAYGPRKRTHLIADLKEKVKAKEKRAKEHWGWKKGTLVFTPILKQLFEHNVDKTYVPSILGIIHRLEEDDRRRLDPDNKKELLSDADIKILEDKLGEMTKIPSQKNRDRLLAKLNSEEGRKEALEQFKLEDQLLSLRKEIVEGFRLARKEGRPYVNSGTYNELQTQRARTAELLKRYNGEAHYDTEKNDKGEVSTKLAGVTMPKIVEAALARQSELAKRFNEEQKERRVKGLPRDPGFLFEKIAKLAHKYDAASGVKKQVKLRQIMADEKTKREEAEKKGEFYSPFDSRWREYEKEFDKRVAIAKRNIERPIREGFGFGPNELLKAANTINSRVMDMRRKAFYDIAELSRYKYDKEKGVYVRTKGNEIKKSTFPDRLNEMLAESRRAYEEEVNKAREEKRKPKPPVPEERIIDKWRIGDKKQITRDWYGLYSTLSVARYQHINNQISKSIESMLQQKWLFDDIIDELSQGNKENQVRRHYEKDMANRGYSIKTAADSDEARWSLEDEADGSNPKARSYSRTFTTTIATCIVMRMLYLKKDSVSEEEIADIAYAINPYIGGLELKQCKNAAKYIAKIVRETPGLEKMTPGQILRMTRHTFRNLNESQTAQLMEALGFIQTKEADSVFEHYDKKMAHLEKTGRLLPRSFLSQRELDELGLLVEGQKSNLYKNSEEGSSDDTEKRLKLDAYNGLNKKVYDYLFVKTAPVRDDFDSDEAYEKAVEEHKAWVDSPAMLAKYRDTLNWLYGKYYSNSYFRMFFNNEMPEQVRRLCAQLRKFGDTTQQIYEFGQRIETILNQTREHSTPKTLMMRTLHLLEPYVKDVDPRRAMAKRNISPAAQEYLKAAYEALLSANTSDALAKLGEIDKKVEKANDEAEKYAQKHGNSEKESKDNHAKALKAINQREGYRLVVPLLRLNSEFKDSRNPERKEADIRKEIERVYYSVVNVINEGVRNVEEHKDKINKEVGEFVAEAKKITSTGKSGEKDLSSRKPTRINYVLSKFASLLIGPFTFKQRLEDMGRHLDSEPKKRFNELMDRFINTPIAAANSNKNKYIYEARKALNGMIARVYGDGEKTTDGQIAGILQMLNTAIEELSVFSASGKKPLSRIQVAAQLAMMSQSDVQAPLIELEAKLKNKEVYWDEDAYLEAGSPEGAEILRDEQRTMITRMRNIPKMHEALNKLSDGKDLAFINEMIAYYKENSQDLDAVAFKITGAPISMDSDSYFPVRRSTEYRASGVERSANVIRSVPDFLSPRQNTTTDINEDSSLFSVFVEQAEKNAHFMAFGEIHYRLSALFENRDWAHLMNRLLGSESAKLVKDHVQDICSPNLIFIDNSGEAAAWAVVRKWTSILLLGGNALVALKQTTSVSAFAHEVGWGKLVKALMKNPFSDEMKAAREELFNSPDAQLRWGAAFIGIQDDLMSRPGKSAKAATMFSRYMSLQRFGDLVPSSIVAPAIYLANYNSLRSRINPETGAMYTEEQAKTLARQMVFDMIEKTQQSSRVSDLGKSQRRGDDLAKLWMQFASNPILHASTEIRAMRDVVANPKNIDNWKKLGGVMASTHIVMPCLIKGLDMLARWLLDDEEPDEDDLYEAIKMVAAGPLSGVVILGNVILGESYGDVSAPAVSFAGRLVRNANNLAEHTVTGEFDKTLEDIHKLTKALIPAYRDTSRVVESRFLDDED